MAWRIVKQPNGMLARFSDIVDNFTDLNLTEAEALELCEVYAFPLEAERRVKAGIEDWKPWQDDKKGDGLSRWKDCLDTIQVIHGKGAVQEILTLTEDIA